MTACRSRCRWRASARSVDGANEPGRAPGGSPVADSAGRVRKPALRPSSGAPIARVPASAIALATASCLTYPFDPPLRHIGMNCRSFMPHAEVWLRCRWLLDVARGESLISVERIPTLREDQL